MGFDETTDILVIGGGHAGIEAATAAARMGRRAMLLTMNLDHIGLMSCNPAVGGLAKGHLVREIDAMGGVMGLAADATGIQFRMLNTSKGPAVRAPRCQSDKQAYARWMKTHLENYPNLDLRQGTVERLLTAPDAGAAGGSGIRAGAGRRVIGVELQCGALIGARAVVVTTGTFLDGMIHIGDRAFPAGRAGDPSSTGLARSFEELGLSTGRLKTGTPPRLDGRTVDFARTQVQPGDETPAFFSHLSPVGQAPALRQIPCHITWTNAATHRVIVDNLGRSAMYGGRIESVGPRYCPSIEDKCVRFADKDAHQVFLEPEGLSTHEIYVNGMSTSLPEDVQRAFIRTIPGLENARIVRPGYAIEYTFVPPSQIDATMAVRAAAGLYFAGQINGTTGYEEAAAQGLLAGVNAARALAGEAPWLPTRDECYIGVLADDLVTKDHREPYRMFTSRAEYRLLLRQDNADLRLTETAHALGLIDEARMDRHRRYRDSITAGLATLRSTKIRRAEVDPELVRRHGLDGLDSGLTADRLLARPDVALCDVEAVTGRPLFGDDTACDRDDLARAGEQVELTVKYDGYIERQKRQVRQAAGMEGRTLPAGLDFAAVHGLSAEAVQKLSTHRPGTFGQAGRIAGVNPSDISMILIHLKAREAA